MRIAVASDLHLEHADLPIFAHRDADVIVLAGDIHISPLGVQNFIVTLPTTTPKLLVLGNHEYDMWTAPALELAEPLYRAAIATVQNAYLLERERFELGDVTFLGATLWSNFERGRGVDAARFISQQIVADPRELIARHRQTIAWLKREVPAVTRPSAKRSS